MITSRLLIFHRYDKVMKLRACRVTVFGQYQCLPLVDGTSLAKYTFFLLHINKFEQIQYAKCFYLPLRIPWKWVHISLKLQTKQRVCSSVQLSYKGELHTKHWSSSIFLLTCLWSNWLKRWRKHIYDTMTGRIAERNLFKLSFKRFTQDSLRYTVF